MLGQSLYRFFFLLLFFKVLLYGLNFILGCFIWLLFIVVVECISNLGINSIGYLGISNTWMYSTNGVILPDGLCSMSGVTTKHERSGFFGTTGFSSLYCVYCAHLILSFKASCIKLFLNCKSWRRIRRLKWFAYIFMFSQLTNVCRDGWWWLSFVVERDESLRLFLLFFSFFFTSFSLSYKLECSPEWCCALPGKWYCLNQSIFPSVVCPLTSVDVCIGPSAKPMGIHNLMLCRIRN